VSFQLRIEGLDGDRVPLVSPEHPEFDVWARPLMGERISDIGLKLKPLLVIVWNQSPQTVVSLSLVWHITHRNRRTTRIWSHASFPEFVCGDRLISDTPDALPSGAQRIEAKGLVIHRWGYLDEYYDQFLGQFVDERNALLADAADVHIRLDAVIFDDGTLVGTDEQSQLKQHFSLMVQARQEWYQQVMERLEADQSVAEAFEPVERFSASVPQRIREGGFRQEIDYQRVNAAAQANRWRRRYSDDQLPSLLRESLRLDPFIIRRQSASNR
jgi:hypothetical protein